MDCPLVQNESSAISARGSKCKWRFLLAVICWCYLLLLAGLIYYIRTWGDQTILATVLLFSPRWIWLLPLLVLTSLAIAFRRRSLFVLGAAAITVIFPLMGFNISWAPFHRTVPGGMPITVIAFNVHQNNLTDPAVARFIADQHPDVVGIEEVPPDFNCQLFPQGQWYTLWDGDQLVASRFPILSHCDVLNGDGTQCVLSTSNGMIEIV